MMLYSSKDNGGVLCRGLMRLRTLDLSPLSLLAILTVFFFYSSCRFCKARWDLDDILCSVRKSEPL